MSAAKVFAPREAVQVVKEPSHGPDWESAEYIELAWSGWHAVRVNGARWLVPSRRIRKTGRCS